MSSLSNGAARRIDDSKAAPPPANRVRRIDSRRTADRNGQSRAENIILSESLYFLRRHWPASCIFLSTGCDGTPERRQRARILGLKRDIAIYQRRAGMPEPYYVEALEGSPELHAHLVAAFPDKAAALDYGYRLERSPTYGSWICGQDDGRDAWRLVDNWQGMFAYLSKEATPQAWGRPGHRRFRRILVSERAGSVSGDRVRPSDALERELIALGCINARTRTYAARSPFPEFREALKNPAGEANRPRAAERPVNTAEFPDTRKEAMAPEQPKGRFISGDSGETGRAEANPLAEQLALPMVVPVIDLAAIAEAKRKDLGLSQREVARMLGIHQPHWSNTINRRHDRFSAWRQNRLREFTADRVAA